MCILGPPIVVILAASLVLGFVSLYVAICAYFAPRLWGRMRGWLAARPRA
jgi:hypothetical protein